MTAPVKNRVVGLEYIRGDEIRRHPKNPRRHPQAQVEALRAVLESVGIAGALLVYRAGDGAVTLIDGECRSANFGETEWPCLVLDVTDDEAAYLLATHDALGGLAEVNGEALDALLRELDGAPGPVATMFGEMFDATMEATLNEAKAGVAGSGGNERAIRKTFLLQPVIAVEDAAVMEAAIRLTGKMNRGEAVTEIFRAYVDSKKGQHDATSKSTAAAERAG